MTARGPLRLLPAPEDRPASESYEARPGAAITGVPVSPGPVPFELATELRVGEPVVWWGEKAEIDRRPIVWTIVVGLLLLGFASLMAPELWAQPAKELLKLALLPLAPASLLAAREWVSLRAVLVTDNSVVVCDHRGRIDRLAFRNVRRVGRDLLTGGVLLEGAQHKVRIPPSLADDARAAIASQTRHAIRSGDRPIDPLGWLP